VRCIEGGVMTNSGDANMADDAGRSRLGRGLAALMGDVGEETKKVEQGRNQRRVPIEFLRPNPRNPRRNFAETELNELAASMRERGIIQPIVVRPLHGAPNSYEIIAGERRWRAAQRAGLHEVPIVPLDVNDDEALQLAIIENVQRADLNPLEEAAGYQSPVRGHDRGFAPGQTVEQRRLARVGRPAATCPECGKFTTHVS
jgi:ParB family transcriptional regulator, chromosome partitioning protein